MIGNPHNPAIFEILATEILPAVAKFPVAGR
jgi:hypothetical protein